MKCAVKICTNEQKKNDKSKSFFHFPRDEELLKKWLQFCQNKGTFKPNKWRTCMDHFKEEDYGGKMYKMGYITKRKLKAGAVPCFYNAKQCSTDQDKRDIRREIIDSLLRECEQSASSQSTHMEPNDEPMRPIPKHYSLSIPAESEDPLEIKIEKVSNEDRIQMLENQVMLLKKENEKLKDEFWRTKRKLECEIENLKKKLTSSKSHCQNRVERFEGFVSNDQMKDLQYAIIKEETE